MCRLSSYTAQALPSHGAVLWPRYKCAFPPLVQDCVPGCNLLRTGGYLALLVAPSPSLGPTLQAHPQNSPSILGSVWSCGRIRFSDRSLDSWARHRRLSDPVVRHNRRSTHSHNVSLDRMSAISSHWRTQRLWIPLEPAPLLAVLGGSKSSWHPSWALYRQLLK